MPFDGNLKTEKPVTPPLAVDAIDDILHRAREGHHPLDVSYIYKDTDDPWKLSESLKKLQCSLPDAIDAVISDRIYIPKDQLPQILLNRILRLAAFPNPEFYKAQSLRLSVWNKPRIIGCAENFPRHIALPRGCLPELENLLHENGVEVRSNDQRTEGKPITVSFAGILRPEQEVSVNAMLKYEQGVLNAPTAFGKTVVAAALIAHRAVNTLVLVHRSELLQQWKERLKMQCGPIRYSCASTSTLIQNMEVRLASITSLHFPVDLSIQSLFKALSQDESRNHRICADIVHAFKEGRKIIVLTERSEHLAILRTLPISWRGTLQQYTGRLNRASPSKQDLRIYDYVELDDKRLVHMWAKRERGYRAMGYRIKTLSSADTT